MHCTPLHEQNTEYKRNKRERAERRDEEYGEKKWESKMLSPKVDMGECGRDTKYIGGGKCSCLKCGLLCKNETLEPDNNVV